MLQTIEDLSIGVWVRESPSIFAYTLVLSLHAIGLAIVLGLNALIALRLLGVAPAIPLSALRSFYGTIWFGFAINAISGGMLFIASATNMGTMSVFWIKMAAVATGMILSLRLKSKFLDDPTATAGGAVPAGARSMAKWSLAVWFFALIAGRMTGYPELITRWFGI
ncbi:MAG: hypothetical protein IPM70_17520 [Proteobacteria bacterium]|jgi:hypothetical protein|nr:hypothetical protein [Pseudomonadota bacterium]MBK7115432.1 hypothetical protein [Pseudomonadota bacterium]MBK9253553.1 hypothetical protein [Pseudomonadota bacterium]MBP6854313.1 hypothetical protein [Rhodoferax sp.]MCC6630571.1 hypothetical protein [Gammaproteobacteria bacterium]